MRTTHTDQDTAEIIELLGTEEPGVLRIRLHDDTEDVITTADFEAHYTAVTPDQDEDDEWTDEDEARYQTRRAQRARRMREAHEWADRQWFAQYGRPRPGCGCPD